jgi:hypothetical protein
MFSMGSPIPFVPLGAGRSGSARPWALLFSRPHNSPPLSRERLNYTPGPSVLRPITPNQSSVRRPLGTINEQALRLRVQIPIEHAAPPGAPPHRDFVPWRFSDAGRISVWLAQHRRAE